MSEEPDDSHDKEGDTVSDKKLTELEVKAFDDLSWDLDKEAREAQRIAEYLKSGGISKTEYEFYAAKAEARWCTVDLIETYVKEHT
jgi:hypothetical protein